MSADTEERSRALAEKLALAFPLVADPQLEIIRAFGVEDEGNGTAWPAVFIVDGGRIAWRDLSDDYRVRPVNQVVLDALDRVMD